MNDYSVSPSSITLAGDGSGGLVLNGKPVGAEEVRELLGFVPDFSAEVLNSDAMVSVTASESGPIVTVWR